MTYRMVVHQAAGMAMMQLDTTIEEALLRLRATAYAEDIRSTTCRRPRQSPTRLSKEQP